jgi:hypothetical protein
MFIILISGFAGSGKDTAADFFSTLGFSIYRVADNVKRQSALYHGFPLNLTETQEGKKTLVTSTKTNETKSVRSFLIEDSLQNKIINNDPAFWARLLVAQIKREAPDFVVISDWRYKAEYDLIKFEFPDSELIKIRVIRDSVIPSTDPSEHEIDDEKFNFTIHNNGSITQLHAECRKILNRT